MGGGAHTGVSANKDTRDNGDNHASGEPHGTKEGQPPNLKGYHGRKGAITGTRNEGPRHGMSLQYARKEKTSHGGNRNQVGECSNDSREGITGAERAQVQKVYSEAKGDGGERVGRH